MEIETKIKKIIEFSNYELKQLSQERDKLVEVWNEGRYGITDQPIEELRKRFTVGEMFPKLLELIEAIL